MPFTTNDTITSVLSETCPACAGIKEAGRTFCGRCLFSLPARLQKRVNKTVDEAYEKAFAECMSRLGRTEIKGLTPAGASPQLSIFGEADAADLNQSSTPEVPRGI
jgi:hypothetical protein